LLNLGKFGSIPASQLLGLPYDITYEILANPIDPSSSTPGNATTTAAAGVTATLTAIPDETTGAESSKQATETDPATNGAAFGQSRGKKRKKGKGPTGWDEGEAGAGSESAGGGHKVGGVRTNPGWRNYLRPLKRQPIVDAIVGE
jgi:hypothetical protein